MLRPALLVCLLLCGGLATAFAQAKDVMLAVVSQDPLPGFHPADEAAWLAAQMNAAGIAGWAARPPTGTPPDRAEWTFEHDPYAGGAVRQFFPQPGVSRLLGPRHRVSAQLKLYLGGEYQTLVFGQATIQGGEDDPDLAAFVTGMTQQLLGPNGALRAIDMGGEKAPR